MVGMKLPTTRLSLDGYDSKEVPGDHYVTMNMSCFLHPQVVGGPLETKHKNAPSTATPLGFQPITPANHYETTANMSYRDNLCGRTKQPLPNQARTRFPERLSSWYKRIC